MQTSMRTGNLIVKVQSLRAQAGFFLDCLCLSLFIQSKSGQHVEETRKSKSTTQIKEAFFQVILMNSPLDCFNNATMPLR